MDEVFRILHTIFNPSFVDKVLLNLNSEPPKSISIKELVPGRCNFPANLTVRSKNLRGNGIAPCRRSLGKGMIYFCSLPRHLAYAIECGLPVDETDIRRMKLDIPDLPMKNQMTKPTHVRYGYSKRRQDKIDSNNIPCSNERPCTVGNEIPTKMEESIAVQQCSFCSPVDGTQCTRIGIHVDVLYRHIRYCDAHITVSDQWINDLFSCDVPENVLELLIAIHKMDKRIKTLQPLAIQ
jgi:hypothetical protein